METCKAEWCQTAKTIKGIWVVVPNKIPDPISFGCWISLSCRPPYMIFELTISHLNEKFRHLQSVTLISSHWSSDHTYLITLFFIILLNTKYFLVINTINFLSTFFLVNKKSSIFYFKFIVHKKFINGWKTNDSI